MHSDKENALYLHNEARRKAQGNRRPDLTWDDDLAEYASKYAKRMGTTGKYTHDTHCGRLQQGENLFYCSADVTLADASKAWIDERKYYKGELIDDVMYRSDKKQVGHYTQVVWPETTRVGTGLFKAPKGSPLSGTFIVARYAPPGNVLGRSAWR